ncbi:uncharacterized protein LOC119180414 [Rhipicephalus microplus]|uniref:uncharacterized protein LOC119180414 n=1 Tax=Rhipicephalus microplus TaxID=6941 RepID=UPI003F6CF17D
MKDNEKYVLYRFTGHPVSGVNWRPTRLVDDVPEVRKCRVCELIPKKIVRLPCKHFLCEYCLDCASQSGSGLCPVDRTTFKVAKCAVISFPAKKANRLKVYCWNHRSGCKFKGPIEDLVQHYENDCVFHLLRCETGRHCLPRELAVEHFINMCDKRLPCSELYHSALQTTAAASADTSVHEDRSQTTTAASADTSVYEDRSETTAAASADTSVYEDRSETTAAASADNSVNDNRSHTTAAASTDASVNENRSHTTAAASAGTSVNVEHDKAQLRDILKEMQLSALQDQMAVLIKRVAHQHAVLKEVIDGQKVVALTLRDTLTEVVTRAISESLPRQPKSKNFTDDDATSSALSLSSEKVVILRKLEHYANVTLGTLEELRQNMRQFDHPAVIARCEPVHPSRDRLRLLTQVQPTNSQVGAEIPSVTYNLTLKNADEIFSSGMEDRTFADVTTWHMRDTYFVVTVGKHVAHGATLFAIEIEFNDLREGAQWLPSSRSVTVIHSNGRRWDLLEVADLPCSCKRSLDKLHHAHVSFLADINIFNQGFCQDKKMLIEIKLTT